MIKLLGRYVSYATPIFAILYGILYENTIPDIKKGLVIVKKAILCVATILFGYWILYCGGIWHPAENWLEGIRGLENLAFIEMPKIYCAVLFIVTLVVLRNSRINICVNAMCLCYCINALAAINNMNSSQSQYAGKAMFQYIYENKQECQVLCMDNDSYGWGGPYVKFYSLDNCKLDCIPVYNEDLHFLESEKNYIFALSENRIDTSILKHRNLKYTEYKNHEVLFVEWMNNLFQEKQDIVLYDEKKKEDDILSATFGYIPQHNLFIMIEDGFIIPVEEITKGNYSFDVKEGYEGDYQLYDLTKLVYMDMQI